MHGYYGSYEQEDDRIRCIDQYLILTHIISVHYGNNYYIHIKKTYMQFPIFFSHLPAHLGFQQDYVKKRQSRAVVGRIPEGKRRLKRVRSPR